MSSKKSNVKLDNKRIKDGDDVSGQRMAFLLLDTTWRVASPIIILSLAGHYFDVRTNHIMLFSLLFFFISLAVATLLVYRQLCIVFPDQFGKNKIIDKKEND